MKKFLSALGHIADLIIIGVAGYYLITFISENFDNIKDGLAKDDLEYYEDEEECVDPIEDDEY